jgi:cytochrome c553
MKIRTILSLTALALLGFQEVRADDPDNATANAAKRIAVGTCATCHGPLGNSISPKFPVLAGQHANYLAAQMEAFRSHTRGDPDALGYMWGMAAPLDRPLILALADYYSRQSPLASSKAEPQLIARGRNIYENGNASEGIPACATCHGAKAEGIADYPRLAGQQVPYLLKQLHSFQTNLRDVAIMHGVAKEMQEQEMKAVAAYLRSL